MLITVQMYFDSMTKESKIKNMFGPYLTPRVPSKAHNPIWEQIFLGCAYKGVKKKHKKIHSKRTILLTNYS